MNELGCMISKRAQAAMEQELGCFPDLETGGLLLGYSGPEQDILVLEATDSGYQNTIHEAGCFQYDAAYEEHMANVLSRLYAPQLRLVGVWHKHNAVHSDQGMPFSRADEKIHAQLMQNGCRCISILFEKDSRDGPQISYKTTVFLLFPDGCHWDITDLVVWGGIAGDAFLSC